MLHLERGPSLLLLEGADIIKWNSLTYNNNLIVKMGGRFRLRKLREIIENTYYYMFLNSRQKLIQLKIFL